MHATALEKGWLVDTPRPVVQVLNIAAGSLQLGGRCWVGNATYWTARCDLLEKTALCLRNHNIRLVPPQVGVQQGPAAHTAAGRPVAAGEAG
jgi:hypothetical protein